MNRRGFFKAILTGAVGLFIKPEFIKPDLYNPDFIMAADPALMGAETGWICGVRFVNFNKGYTEEVFRKARNIGEGLVELDQPLEPCTAEEAQYIIWGPRVYDELKNGEFDEDFTQAGDSL